MATSLYEHNILLYQPGSWAIPEDVLVFFFFLYFLEKKMDSTYFLGTHSILPPISDSSVLEILDRRQWHPTPVLLPGKSHGWRSLVGCSPWGCDESDMTERLHFHFHTLEKETATHSSVLAWRIPGMGSHRVGHD